MVTLLREHQLQDAAVRQPYNSCLKAHAYPLKVPAPVHLRQETPAHGFVPHF